jgi:hypothetical protein
LGQSLVIRVGDDEMDAVVKKNGVERLEAPEFAKGGNVNSDLSDTELKDLVERLSKEKTLDKKEEYALMKAKYMLEKRDNPNKMADGGMVTLYDDYDKSAGYIIEKGNKYWTGKNWSDVKAYAESYKTKQEAEKKLKSTKMADGGEVKNSIDILYNIVKNKDDGFILFKKEATPIILSTCYQYPDTELTPIEMQTDQFINSSFISTEGEIKITFNAIGHSTFNYETNEYIPEKMQVIFSNLFEEERNQYGDMVIGYKNYRGIYTDKGDKIYSKSYRKNGLLTTNIILTNEIASEILEKLFKIKSKDNSKMADGGTIKDYLSSRGAMNEHTDSFDNALTKKDVIKFIKLSKDSDKKYWIRDSTGFSKFLYKGQLRANDSVEGIFKATKIGVDRLNDSLKYRIMEEELFGYEKEQVPYLDQNQNLKEIPKNSINKDWSKYVNDNSGYLKIEEETEDTIQLVTRKNGNVGDEEYSQKDVQEAKDVYNKIKEKYPNTKAKLYNVDEWVYLELTYIDKMADGGMMAEGGISYSFEYKDNEGDTYQDNYDNISEAKKAIKEIQNSGGRILETFKHRTEKDGTGTFIGRFEKGGEITPYIIWVSKDGEKRELFGQYKSKRAADMQMNKLWEKGEYKSMGNKPKSMYEKEGFYDKGGKVTFQDKVKSIKASLLKTKKVPKRVQKDYGKTYNAKEAELAAKRIAGSIRKKGMK